jgi:DNA-binding transcriptional ArsR family regulator
MELRKDNDTLALANGADRRLPGQVIELTAERLRVIAEPNRIALLEALNAGGEASVQGLADWIGAPHQKASKHLAVLYGAGMVSRRRGEGTTVLYTLVDWTGWWVVEQIARWVQSGLDGEESDQAAGEESAA